MASWDVIAGRVTGRSHLAAGRPCQDAVLWTHGEGFLAVAVADGHGGARSPYSDVGAMLAVEVAVELLAEFHRELPRDAVPAAYRHFAEQQLPRRLVHAWQQRVMEADHAGPEAGGLLVSYGTTLLACLACEQFLYFLQIGDGDILTVDAAGRVQRPLPADPRLLGNDTTSLSGDQAWRDARVRILPGSTEPPELVLLASDGYGNSFADEAGLLQAAGDFLNLVQAGEAPQVRRALDGWLAETSAEGSGDDISVALLHRDAVHQRYPR